MLARGVHAPEVLAAAASVVVLFAALPVVSLPVGMITADEPVRLPLYLIEPILLAIIATPLCFSAASTLEATAARRARRWHALTIGVVVALVCGLLAMQPNVLSQEVPRVLATYLGSMGMMLLGATTLGQLGWLVPLAYLLMLSVIGASGFGELSFWAWSVQPIGTAAPSALLLLAAGSAALAARWRTRALTG